MDLMEVNYGPQMASQSQVQIEGAKVPSRGFIICRECGKTVTKEVADAEECHYPFCHHKDVPYPPHEEADMDVFMLTYLPIAVTALFVNPGWKPIKHKATTSAIRTELGQGASRREIS